MNGTTKCHPRSHMCPTLRLELHPGKRQLSVIYEVQVSYQRVELRYSFSSASIKFKHVIALTDMAQTMLPFPRKIKVTAAICLNLIGEP